jgi:hypothetical protein
MSGECTVTPGTSWSADPITDLKLNQTANPTVRVEESAIGLRELDVEGVAGAIIGGTVLTNWLRNPYFYPAQNSVYATGARCQTSAAGWYLLGTGATLVSTAIGAVATNPGGKYGLITTISHGIAATVSLGQAISGSDGYALYGRTVTFEVDVINQAGVNLTPKLRIKTWTAAEDARASTLAYDAVATGPITVVNDGATQRLLWTLTFDTAIDPTNGFDVEFYFAFTPTGFPRTITIARPSMVIAGGSVTFSAAAPRPHPRISYDAVFPGATHDLSRGYLPGDQIYSTYGTVFICESAEIGAAKWAYASPSRVANLAYNQITTTGSTAVVIPADNTIPQITEGAEILTLVIAPADIALNGSVQLKFNFHGIAANSVAGTITVALFKDAISDALFACPFTAAANAIINIDFTCIVTSGGAGTYRIRVGSSTGTCHWNKAVAGDLMGGRSVMALVVEQFNILGA